MPAQLLALSEGPHILLDKPIMLFGRNPECDIQIESRKISRRHCCIAQVNDYLVVRDLGSTNGIRINGVRVNEGRLKAGDELTIGSHRYQVRWDALDSRGSRDVSLAPAPPLPVKSPVPPASVDDDDLLEECDEPVPLEEPGAGPRSPAPPVRTELARDEGSIDVEAVPEPSPAPLLPDDLDLAPFSDIHQPERPPLNH
jgi:predicted component of type VI protein secretion system